MGCGNKISKSLDFIFLYGVKPNDENDGIEDSNDKNMGGEDTDLQAQPSYPDFSSYFITDEVYFITFICMWFAIE